MKRSVVLVALALLACGAAGVFWLNSGPDPAQFAHLTDPRFATRPDETMLVVEATGDPNIIGSRAFSTLFRTYFGLDGVSRLQRPPAPRARWPKPAETPKPQWVGQYALPVPAAVSTLSANAGDAELTAVLTTWAYGDVAEVLHVGSYASEAPDIIRLHEFVASNGYRVIGDHEEEYVSGPGMFFAGNPEKYLTIIRVRVERGRP